jgi:hypothetical protein
MESDTDIQPATINDFYKLFVGLRGGGGGGGLTGWVVYLQQEISCCCYYWSPLVEWFSSSKRSAVAVYIGPRWFGGLSKARDQLLLLLLDPVG